MRPLRLRMQAFGPYAKNVEIDFRQLQGAGIFLIHGQTGAGKTSVLDGLCFALFGTSSGDRKGENLRSDFAKADLKTEVILEFALGKDIYRIQREPSQEIKKKRGEGTKNSNPEAHLFKLASELKDSAIDEAQNWTLLTAGNKKTDEEVAQLIGMNEDQFRQVVVLPQGQFRKFLAATSDAREKLLETLFRGEKYRKLAEFLDTRSRALEVEIRSTRQSFAAHLAAFEVEDEPSFAKRLHETAATLLQLREGTQSLQGRFDLAAQRRTLALSAQRLTLEHTSLEARQTALRARAPEITRLIERLEQERRARPVLSCDSVCLAISRDLNKLTLTKTSEEAVFLAATKTLEQSANSLKTLEARQPEIEGLKAQREGLLQAWKSAEQLKSEKNILQEAILQLKKADVDLTAIEQDVAALKAKALRYSEQILSNQEKLGRFEALKAEQRLKAAALTGLRQEFSDYDSARRALASAETCAQSCELALHQATTAALNTKRNFHLSQAALLALELKKDQPCPVCGSLVHPLPANAEATVAASAEAVESSLKEQQVAAEAFTKARAQFESTRADLNLRETRLGLRFEKQTELTEQALQTVVNLESEIAAIQQDLHSLENSARDLANAKTLHGNATKELPIAEKRLFEATTLRNQLQTLSDSTQGKVSHLEASLAPDHRDLVHLKSLGTQIAAQIKNFETERDAARTSFETATRSEAASHANLETLSTQIADKTNELEIANQHLRQALIDSGFETLELCRSVGLEGALMTKYENDRRAFEQERAVVESRTQELTAQLGALPPWAFDLATCEAEFASIENERAQSQALQLSLEEQLKQLKAGEDRLTALTKSLHTLEKRFQTAGRLAGVALGQPPHNSSRVNFQRYVLAAQFDEVLELASRRLHGMSRGQFQLRRASSQEDKRKSAGLELEVEDSLSGTSRPTASLSGGEGFIASLCLALALADVVQSQLGGVRLEAVFIDEGFGTLDPEALELAMKTLGELQAGGRMVGIISHVPELKDQIARRLIIRKTPLGSDANWENSL